MAKKVKKHGRPPKVQGELRRSVGFSLGDAEIEAIRELSRLRGEPQSVVLGDLIMREMTAEMMRRKRRQEEEGGE